MAMVLYDICATNALMWMLCNKMYWAPGVWGMVELTLMYYNKNNKS